MIGPDFDHFCAQVRQRSGLVLGPDKVYLLKARLEPIARAEGLADVPSLLARIRRGACEPLLEKCVNALATHESSFFRDGAPFESLQSMILPQLLAARHEARTLRIWCAACSSGQEPFSIAILLKEMGAKLAGWRVEILATDFSRPILERAAEATYSDFEVKRGLSPERLGRWFEAVPGGWRVRSEVREMVTFRPHNLLERASALGTFDIVFCRNVLIYFDGDRKQKVLDELARALAPDGALFLGAAESIIGLPAMLEAVPGLRGLCRKTGLQAKVA
jgi:chemotaxis protein methyltransferase CheR